MQKCGDLIEMDSSVAAGDRRNSGLVFSIKGMKMQAVKDLQ